MNTNLLKHHFHTLSMHLLILGSFIIDNQIQLCTSSFLTYINAKQRTKKNKSSSALPWVECKLPGLPGIGVEWYFQSHRGLRISGNQTVGIPYE